MSIHAVTGASLAMGAVAFAAGCIEPDSVLLARIAQNLDVRVTYSLVRRGDVQYLEGSVAYTNRGGERIYAFTGPYKWWFKAYRSPERRGTPIWNLDDHLGGGPDVLVILDLAPRQSQVEPAFRSSVAQILGPNPPGRYYFTVQLELIEPRGRTAEIPAGEVDLPAPGAGGDWRTARGPGERPVRRSA